MNTPEEAKSRRKPGPKRENYEARFSLSGRLADLSIPEPNSGCFLWFGALNDGGYGRIKHKMKFRRAHIVAWELAHGKVPDGLVIDHKCRVRCCVNPDHMELVTIGENIRRGVRHRIANGEHPCPWTLKHGKRSKHPDLAAQHCGLAGRP